ncbi:MAG: radical SAM protein, partial [Clostridia bacterium]|nr:radical SAM protein [Clostridia bacterium]
MAECEVCFRHCRIPDGSLGFCGARISRNGRTEAYNYGRITSLALDPIEKKPLRRFYPGSMILSVGSFGCNLRCPFCQNSRISWSEEAKKLAETAETVSPELLVELAISAMEKGNIGIAFTYNEPLVGYEFVRDTSKIAKSAGLKTVAVTNGQKGAML